MTAGGDGHDNGDNPWGQNDPGDDNSNVVPLDLKRKKLKPPKKSSQKQPQATPPNNTEPLINLPPYTKYILAVMIGIHLIVTFLLNEEQAYWVFIHLGFIPGRFTGEALFEPLALLTPFTHMLLHGGWMHIIMNTVMLLAFGSGVERWLGGKKMIAFFIMCGLFGVIAHFALNYNSIAPVIGASGGLSGLFAAAIIMLNRKHGNMTGKYGMWPFILLWIGISVLFGSMGAPDGSQIAWAAHVGGFLGGFAVLKWMRT